MLLNRCWDCSALNALLILMCLANIIVLIRFLIKSSRTDVRFDVCLPLGNIIILIWFLITSDRTVHWEFAETRKLNIERGFKMSLM